MSQTPDQALAYKPNARQIVCLAKKTGAAASAYAAASTMDHNRSHEIYMAADYQTRNVDMRQAAQDERRWWRYES